MAIHDVFEDPAEGGRGPHLIYRRASDEGFARVAETGSMRVLRKGVTG